MYHHSLHLSTLYSYYYLLASAALLPISLGAVPPRTELDSLVPLDKLKLSNRDEFLADYPGRRNRYQCGPYAALQPEARCFRDWVSHRANCAEIRLRTKKDVERAAEFDAFWGQVQECVRAAAMYRCPAHTWPTVSYKTINLCTRRHEHLLPESYASRSSAAASVPSSSDGDGDGGGGRGPMAMRVHVHRWTDPLPRSLPAWLRHHAARPAAAAAAAAAEAADAAAGMARRLRLHHWLRTGPRWRWQSMPERGSVGVPVRGPADVF
ncbi:MAG: hypothetical protein M1826_003585 [Phylliscum demangeonii]|nr:MAG: hypothetical protein M1826_003585 [Phylliscum demangeonii]